MNSGPPVPQTGALTGLRYAPNRRNYKHSPARREPAPTENPTRAPMLGIAAGPQRKEPPPDAAKDQPQDAAMGRAVSADVLHRASPGLLGSREASSGPVS